MGGLPALVFQLGHQNRRRVLGQTYDFESEKLDRTKGTLPSIIFPPVNDIIASEKRIRILGPNLHG